MKIKKITAGVIACFVTVLLLISCQSYPHKRKVENDCSTAFKTRYIDNKELTASSKLKAKTANVSPIAEELTEAENSDSQLPTECKVLELKVDRNTRCEIVGSDKIDNVSQVLKENKQQKIIIITPTNKFRDLTATAQKYLSSNGIEVKKYFESDLFKSLDFPYKGMRCTTSGKEFEVWLGKKQVLITLAGF